MERGVRQGSKEGPLLFKITFRLVPEEVYNLATQMGITLVTANGDERKLGHIEYADDRCLIVNTIAEAEGLLQRLDTVLTKFQIEMATEKIQWMCLGEEPEQKLLHLRSKSIERVRSHRFRGSSINTLGDATEAISGGIANGCRQLMKIGPILRSSVLAVQTKARLVEIFLSPAIYYGLSTIVLRIRDNNRISALLNTARREILGLNSSRILMADELRLIGSCLREQADKKRAHTKCWNRQIQADAKELFSGDAKGWLANSCSKIPENDQHRPNLVGSGPQIIQCSKQNCSRWFARRAEMLRHARQDHGAVAKQERAKLSCPVTDCHKQYKMRGWLNKHLQFCHPEVISTASGKREQPSRATTPLPPERRGFEKGTRNHGYEKHNWSVARSAPIGEGRKKRTTTKKELEDTATLPNFYHPNSRDKLETSTEMPHLSLLFTP
ncbi:hypothetical protein ACTXT7_014423 [Hymenolepis weldensis]